MLDSSMTNLANRPPLGLKPAKEAPDPARMAKVKQLPCVVCGAPPPSDAHHCICGRYGTRKAPDSMTIPLCKECHQDGPQAIHRGKASWIARNGNDFEFLDAVNEQIEAMERQAI